MYYHVWFSPKRRKWLLIGEVNEAVRKLFEEAAREKGIRLIAYETIVDHVHLLLEVDRVQDLSRTVGHLKGRTAQRVFKLFPDLKFDAKVEHFWQRSYGSKLVPPEDLDGVGNYIRAQWGRLEKFDRGGR